MRGGAAHYLAVVNKGGEWGEDELRGRIVMEGGESSAESVAELNHLDRGLLVSTKQPKWEKGRNDCQLGKALETRGCCRRCRRRLGLTKPAARRRLQRLRIRWQADEAPAAEAAAATTQNSNLLFNQASIVCVASCQQPPPPLHFEPDRKKLD